MPTFDKKLSKLFAYYTNYLLLPYYPLFIIFPIILTSFLGLGFLWIKELTLLNARRLYTPITAPAWNEEKVMKEVMYWN